MEAYLDNSATTRCLDDVAKEMTRILTEGFGNPSSMHLMGLEAEKSLREATERLCKILKCDAKEIIYTSGGTESDNLALVGCAMANKRAGMHLITTKVEHPAILQTMKYLESLGFEVTYLPVDEKGIIRLSDLEAAIRKDTILVSVMHTNNEIGSLMPIEEAGALIKRINPGCLFHVDAVQGFGKARIIPSRMHIDLMSVSAHKIHGPKGVGFLYVGSKVKINPILFGGGQQKNMRSGTENVPGIYGMALAASSMYENLDADRQKLYELKEHFTKGLLEIENVTINGPMYEEGAPHIVSASFRGVRSEVLLHSLEDKGIFVSAGSACASNRPHVSDTLVSIGTDKELLDSTIRFSFSVFTTREELDYTLECLQSILPALRKYTRR